MCKFIIVKTLDGLIFRKGATFCENGLKGMMCIDTQKIYASPNTQTILIRSGNAIVTTPSITSIMIENFLQSKVVLIETDIIAPQLQRFMTANIGCVEQMYLNMKRYGDLYPPTVESPEVSVVDSVQTTRVRRSSQVKIRAASTVAPSDSISCISRSPQRKHRNDAQDSKSSVAEWMEKSSDAATDVTKVPRSPKPLGSLKEDESMVSVATSASRVSSRRMSSYAMARQMTIRE
jgi:hypothetical protein